jgi:translocation and assembly module TamB
MGAQSLIISRPDLRIEARDIRLIWRPAELLRGRLAITALTARDVEVLSLPSPYPDDLRLPLPLSLQKLDIGTLKIFSKQGGTPDFTAGNLTVKFDSDGSLHRIQDLHANLDYDKLTASGQMTGSRPFALQAQADLAGLTDFTGLDAKEAHITATVSGNLAQLAINAAGSGAGLTGYAEVLLTPYATFPLAKLQLQVRGLNPRAFSPQAPTANLTLQADLHGNASGQIEGDVTANNLSAAPIDRDGLPLLGAHAHATLSADLLKFDNLTVALAKNGSVLGNLAWHRKQMTGSADLTISHLDPAGLDTRLRTAKLGGSIKLSGDNKAQLGVLTLNDGSLQLGAHLAKAGNMLTLDELRISRGQAALTGEGKLKLDGQQAYSFNGRLHRFDLAAFIQAAHSDLNATLELAGELAPKAAGTLRFMMNDSRLAGQPVSGNGHIEFTGISLGRGEAELRLGDNRLSARGGIGSATDRLQLDLAAPALEQFGAGYGGTLNAHASLAGSLSRPEVTFEAEGYKLAVPGDHYLGSLSAVAGLHGEALTLTVNAADYRTQAITQMQNLQLEVHGSRSHHELNTQVHLDKNSHLVLRANGGLSDFTKELASIQWQGVLTELTGTGALPFKLQASTPLTLAVNHCTLATAEFIVAGGHVHIDSADWTPQRWDSRGSFTGIGLHAGTGSQPDFTTPDDKTVLRLGGEWNLASATQSNLRITKESGDWLIPGEQPMPLGLQTLEFTARATNGRLAAELTAQGARLGDWRASVAMPLAQSGWTVPGRTPLTGQIHINVADLAWLGPAINDNLKSGGRLSLEAAMTGTVSTPTLHGQVRGDDLALALLDQGVRLQQGQLAAHFDQDSLHIDTLSFITPHEPQPKDSLLSGLNIGPEPGKISASGVLGLNGQNGDLEIIAKHLPLSQRPDRWIIATGHGHATLNKKVLALNGDITADAGLISQTVTDRPQLSDDIVITGRQVIVRKGPQLSVDATLNLGEHFYLRASGLEARLGGQLSVRDAPGQQLRVTGSIAALDASFEAYGQRLTVERGIVNFQGPLSDPGLNILAVRRGLPVEAGVAVTGTALHPAVKLVSTPAVPDVEKLSWIVLGRAPNTTGTDSSLLLSAAGSILGSGSGGITGQLKQALGVDELSLRQEGNALNTQAINDNPLSSQIVTVGKRLSQRAFISYAQGVTAVAGVTKLTYTLTPRVNIVTQAGMDNAIDVFYTFSFD